MKLLRFFLVASCLTTLSSLQAQSYSSAPSNDLWVYSHAQDPGGDAVLRVWGDGTSSYNPSWPPGDAFSHGYLKFDLSGIALGTYDLTSATLTVTHRVTAAGTFTKEVADANPLEARALGTNFSEGTWNYNDPSNPAPQSTVYGNGDLSQYNSAASFQIPINLLGADFNAAFNAAVNGDQQLAIALTRTMPVSGMVGSSPYRIYSKDHSVSSEFSILDLQYQVVPEPRTLIALTAGIAAVAKRHKARKG